MDEKTKPIPFLIRNTTAEGMPISIGSLRAVNTPAFSSFNPFIKRLPPPKKYVFEPRQVLPGDIVDPYNYLRALFRGEVILTSDRLPTFASPRVSGTATSSTESKVPGAMYTSRSPQGFNPMMYSKKKETPTTTSRPASASFFGNIGLSSKGEGTDVERMPLPVGMLGTPAPNFKDFNFRDFVNQMKKKKAMGGRIDLSRNNPSIVNQNKVNTVTQNDATTNRSPAIEMFIESVKNKNLPSMDTVMNNFKQNKDQVKTLQSVVTGLKNQNIPTIDDIMRKINSQQSASSFPTIPAVPGKETFASKNKFMFETAVPKPSKPKSSFNPLPAVPDLETSTQDENRQPKSQFKHFPSTTTERQVIEMRKSKALTFDTTIETSGIRRGKALQKLKDFLSPMTKPEPENLESNIKNNPNLYKTSFSPSTQRSVDRLQDTKKTTTSKPKTPHGTIRSEIMSILKSKKTTKSSSSQKSRCWKSTRPF